MSQMNKYSICLKDQIMNISKIAVGRQCPLFCIHLFLIDYRD